MLSTKKRGPSKKTLILREAILDVFNEVDKPVTVRQMFYLLTSCGAVPKTETQGYRPVQRQLVLMRRERLIPYEWIADNTRWMRKPATYEGLGDFFVGERTLVSIPIGSRQIIAVPPAAIVTRHGLDFVTIIQGQVPVEVSVIPGETFSTAAGPRTEIVTGLRAGDTVVVP